MFYSAAIIPKDGRGRAAALLQAAQTAQLVVAHIDARDQIGRKAHKPGVVLVVGGAGLARNNAAFHLGPAACALVHHFLEQGGHNIGVLRADGLPVLHVLPVKFPPAGIGDGGDDARAHAQPLIGKSRIGLGQVKGRNGHRAQADGQLLRKVRFQPQGLGPLHHVGYAHLLRHPHGTGIARKSQGRVQGQLALVVVLVVGRPPDFVGIRIDIDEGRVQHGGGGRKAIIQSGGVDHGFEAGAGLPPGLGGAVEVAVPKLVAADKGHHVAVAGFHRSQRPLHHGFLLQTQGHRRALLGLRGIKGLGDLRFAAFGILARPRQVRSRNPDHVAGGKHLTDVLDGRGVNAGHLGIGFARPGHLRHGDDPAIAPPQGHAGLAGLHTRDQGLDPAVTSQIQRRKGAGLDKGLLRGRIQLLQGAAPALALVQLFQSAPQGRAGGLLLHRVHGRAHCKSGLINVVRAVFARIHAQSLKILLRKKFNEQAPGFFQIPKGRAAHAFGHAPVDQGLGSGLSVFFRRNPFKIAQTAQHIHLPGFGLFGSAEGIVRAGGLGQTGNNRALGQGNVRRVFAEVGAGRSLHAVGVFTQVDLVEVDGEDLVLGVVLLHPVGQDGFLHLAGVTALGGKQQLFDELLGDGAAALALPTLAEVVDGRAQNGHRVHAHMLVEAVVLGRQKGHGQIARHVLEADDVTFFMVQGAQNGVVPGQNDRGLGLLVLGQAVEVRQIARSPVKQHGHGGRTEHAAHKQQTHQPEQALFKHTTHFHEQAIPFFGPEVKKKGRKRARRGGAGPCSHPTYAIPATVKGGFAAGGGAG